MSRRWAALRVSLAFLGCSLPAMAVLAGCSAVLTVAPVGSEPIVLDPNEWDGLWCDVGAAAAAAASGTLIDERGCLVLTVIDPEEGTLKAADPTSHEPEQAAIVRREPRSGAVFLTIPWPPEADGEAFWVRIRMRDDVLIFWEPRVDVFRDLVAAGALPGVSGTDVVLFRLDGEALATLDEQHASLFRWDDPQVLVRVGR